MLAIGRALMAKPKMLLLDEPSIDVYKRQKHGYAFCEGFAGLLWFDSRDQGHFV